MCISLCRSWVNKQACLLWHFTYRTEGVQTPLHVLVVVAVISWFQQLPLSIRKETIRKQFMSKKTIATIFCNCECPRREPKSFGGKLDKCQHVTKNKLFPRANFVDVAEFPYPSDHGFNLSSCVLCRTTRDRTISLHVEKYLSIQSILRMSEQARKRKSEEGHAIARHSSM